MAGQVFEVSDETLAGMDALERVSEPDGFRRVCLKVMQGEDSLNVFAYLKNPAELVVADIRQGPLAEYTQAHAVLYRKCI